MPAGEQGVPARATPLVLALGSAPLRSFFGKSGSLEIFVRPIFRLLPCSRTLVRVYMLLVKLVALVARAVLCAAPFRYRARSWPSPAAPAAPAATEDFKLAAKPLFITKTRSKYR